MKPGRRRLLGEGVAEEAAEKRKASVRAKVEHPFLYVKRHFGYAKVRYRGVAKNRQRIALLLGFSNLLMPATDVSMETIDILERAVWGRQYQAADLSGSRLGADR